MPISNSSRYSGLPTYDATDAAGETHATIAIRPSTPPAPGATTYRHVVTGLESIESLAASYIGSSASWWRIAEANPLRFPLDVTPGMVIEITSPGDVGRIVRTRRF